jgi:hypothetical protein
MPHPSSDYTLKMENQHGSLKSVTLYNPVHFTVFELGRSLTAVHFFILTFPLEFVRIYTKCPV